MLSKLRTITPMPVAMPTATASAAAAKPCRPVGRRRGRSARRTLQPEAAVPGNPNSGIKPTDAKLPPNNTRTDAA